MGPNPAQKKIDITPDWMLNSEPVEDDTPEWMLNSEPVEKTSRFDPTAIDPTLEAPPIVRNEVGSYDKPEDRLTVLQKSYPDAEPYGDGNFIMTDPQSGKTMIYNRESWIPTMGDFASITPEIGEGIGGIVGAVGGAAAGTLAGPGPGNVVGGIAGAGAGGTAGRETVQRVQRYLYGNADTRDGGTQLLDAGKTFGMNAAGEGAGRAVAAVASPIIKKAITRVVGRADNPAAAVARVGDMRAIGIEPTAGMATLNPKTMATEGSRILRGGRVADLASDVPGKIGGRFDQTVQEITTQTNPNAVTGSRQSLGTDLQGVAKQVAQAQKDRTKQLFGQVDTQLGANTMTGSNTSKLLDDFRLEKKGLTNAQKINLAPALDDAIKQTDAITKDLKTGATFSEMQEARTAVGKLANDRTADATSRDYFKRTYDALSKDMEETAQGSGDDVLKTWKDANAHYSGQFAPDSPMKVLKSVLKSEEPEKELRKLFASAKDGGTRLASVKKQVIENGGQETWDRIAGSHLEELGTGGIENGAFDSNKFRNGWDKLSTEAKDAIYGPKYRADLDQLQRVIKNTETYTKGAKGQKKPGVFTRGNLLTGALGTSVLGHSLYAGDPLIGATVAAGAIAAKVTSGAVHNSISQKLLTSPQVVNWLAKIPKAEMERGGLATHMKRLASMREQLSPTVAKAVTEYLNRTGYKEDDAK